MVSASRLLEAVSVRSIRARTPSASVRVSRSSGGVKSKRHCGAVVYAHTSHGTHRPTPQSHRAARPVVPKVSRRWHRAVIRRDAGEGSPGPARRALFAPHRGSGDSLSAESRGKNRPPYAPLCAAVRKPPDPTRQTGAEKEGCQV